jgi:hypothetical protein
MAVWIWGVWIFDVVNPHVVDANTVSIMCLGANAALEDFGS